MEKYNIPDLHTAISFFIRNGNSGASHHRGNYVRAMLPPAFEHLDIWSHIHMTQPPINKGSEPDSFLVRARHSEKFPHLTWDPVLVEMAPDKPDLNSE